MRNRSSGEILSDSAILFVLLPPLGISKTSGKIGVHDILGIACQIRTILLNGGANLNSLKIAVFPSRNCKRLRQFVWKAAAFCAPLLARDSGLQLRDTPSACARQFRHF